MYLSSEHTVKPLFWSVFQGNNNVFVSNFKWIKQTTFTGNHWAPELNAWIGMREVQELAS